MFDFKSKTYKIGNHNPALGEKGDAGIKPSP
jgi:hypothetical protein